DGVAAEADRAGGEVGAVVGDHAGGVAAGGADDVVVDVVAVQQVGRRGGVAAGLLRAGDAVVVARQPVAVDLDVEAGRRGDAAVPVPAAVDRVGVAVDLVAADHGVLADLVEDPLGPVVDDQVVLDQGVV